MRYVVYGAGAIGGLVGGRMFEAGSNVTLIARGDHLAALRKHGLTIEEPDRTRTLKVPAVGSPAEAVLEPGDVVLSAMKTQDSAAAFAALAAAAPAGVSVVCLQNGVENERLALRHFQDVYAVPVMCPASHLEPGVVQGHSSPIPGLFDVGLYPAGSDETAEGISQSFRDAGFDSGVRADVMRWKWAKLLMNLGNAADAALAPGENRDALIGEARAEGERVLRAAGIDFASAEEDRERRGDLLNLRPIDGKRRGGGSTWQSIARGTGSIEVDYLNGEIAMLGRVHDVPTPVNVYLQRTANALAASGGEPHSVVPPPVETLTRR